LLMVRGDASTEEGALAFAEAVAAETQTQIQTQQRGVGAEEDAQVMAQSVTPQPVAEEQTGSRLRALVALSVVGLAVSVGACFVVDGAVSAAALKRALGRQRGEGAGGRPSGTNAPPPGAGVACGVCGSAVCDDPEHALHLLETALLADRGGADDRRGAGSAAPDPFEDFLPPWRSGRSSR
jgi:hypothetical protein